jgi:dienelactone hydrolase
MLARKTILVCVSTLLLALAMSGSRAAPAGTAPPLPPVMSHYERVTFDSHGSTIQGFVVKTTAADRAPGAVLTPACGGIMAPNGRFVRPFYRDMVDVLNNAGITVLLVDGFTPRGHKEICSIRPNDRTIDTVTRLRDTLGGMQYLRSRDDINADKIFLISYGAGGNFLAMNKTSPYYDEVGKGFTAAVMFYPHCKDVDTAFEPYAPIQVFVGAEDGWNPPKYCEQLKQEQVPGSAAFNLKIYPDTHHGFVMLRDPRLFRGQPVIGPVMVGGNRKSAADAYKMTKAFLSGF